MASDAGVIAETANGLIVNRIVWSDEVLSMDFGEGLEAVQEPADQDYAIGGTLLDGAYTPPLPPPVPPQPQPQPEEPTVEQQILFDHENRIRAQEGAPPLTLEDFVASAQKRKMR